MANINEQQLKFCEEYVANGYKPMEAYMKAYEVEDKNSASACACALLRKQKIIDMVKEVEGNYKIISMQQGVDKRMIIEKIKEMLNATKRIFKDGEIIDETLDYAAINNGINTWAKLTGEFEAEKKAITFEDSGIAKDPSKMTTEEIKEEKEKILKAL